LTSRKQREGIAVYAFAKKMRVSDNAVRSRIRSGRLAAAVYDDGSLNEELATELWKKRPPARRKKVLVPPGERRARISEEAEEAGTEYEIKLERMRVALEVEKINLEKLRNSTVDREEARRAVRAFGRGVRDLMLNFANRYGAGLAAELGCDAATLIGALDAKMREMLLEGMAVPAPYHAQGETPIADDHE